MYPEDHLDIILLAMVSLLLLLVAIYVIKYAKSSPEFIAMHDVDLENNVKDSLPYDELCVHCNHRQCVKMYEHFIDVGAGPCSPDMGGCYSPRLNAYFTCESCKKTSVCRQYANYRYLKLIESFSFPGVTSSMMSAHRYLWNEKIYHKYRNDDGNLKNASEIK